jgi:hypothetical protein
LTVVAAVIAARVRLTVVAAVIAARVRLTVVVVVVVIVIVIWIACGGPNGSSSNDCGGAHAWAVIAPAIISATVGAARYGTAAIRYPTASPYGATAIRYPAASCYDASASCARRKGFSRNTRDTECGDRSEGNDSTVCHGVSFL